MKTPEIDPTPSGNGLSRRTLIKGAAVAGAAAWTAPVLIDSLSSPAAAAACSSAPTLTFKTSVNGNPDTATGNWTTPSFATTAGTRLVVYINTSNATTTGHTSSSVASLSGAATTGAATSIASVLNYNNNNTNRTHDLFCYRIAASGSTGVLTVSFGGTVFPSNCSIAVYQVAGATSFGSTTGNANNSNSASLTYANAGAGQSELWCVAGGRDSTTSFNWNLPGGFNWTEDVDAFNDAGGSNSRAFSFETARRTTLTANSGTFGTTGTPAATPDWAAIRVLCGC